MRGTVVAQLLHHGAQVGRALFASAMPAGLKALMLRCMLTNRQVRLAAKCCSAAKWPGISVAAAAPSLTPTAQLTHSARQPAPHQQIDIGAQWDALLPCYEDQWEEAAPFLQPGDEVGGRGCVG